jgi:hypothetical protein
MFDPEKFGEAMGEAIRAAVEPLLARIKELESSLVDLQNEANAQRETVAMVGKDGDKGERGEKGDDGLGLAGAMIDRDGSLLITLTNGEVKSLGKVVGKDGQNGNDGKDGLSLESFDMQYLPESHEITVKAVCQGRSKELRYPAGGIRPAGYWREGTKAKAGEAWVHGGSTFYAIKDNESKPSTNDDAWIIGARAGRDGERGATGKVVSDAPIKLVN